MRVCLGGTFDRIHIAHEALLRKAFEVSRDVFIGVTSDRLAQERRERKVRPFAQRRQDLEAFLRRHRWKAVVAEIDHPFGRSTDKDYDAIVVSPETAPRVAEIDAARAQAGLGPLQVFTIPFFYGDDGLRITATRLATGEIDGRGRRRKPLRIAVGTHNSLKVGAARDAFRRAFPRLRLTVRGFRVATGVPEQPRDTDTFRGAWNRAHGALAAWREADYGIGVEAGLLWDPFMNRWKDVQYAVAVDRQGGVSAGHGGGFYYPNPVTNDVLAGKTISDIVGPLAGDPRVGSTIGAVGFLSRGALERRELTAHGILLALVPRIHRDLYQE